MSAFKEYILLTCLILFLDFAVGQKETIDIDAESPALTSMKFLAGFPIVRSYSSKVPAGTCSYGGEKLPDDTDCYNFYVCEGTPPIPVSYKCFPITPFNPNTNECDPDYQCTSPITCTSVRQTLENPDNCASYYICSDTLQPVLVNCGLNQFYAQDVGNCRNTTYVACGERPGCLYEGQSFPNYKDCNSFYTCNKALSPIKHYCSSGQSYDSETNRCVATATAHCAGGTVQNECTVPGQKLPNPKDSSCQTYYICNSHLELDKWKCPYGQQFDSEKLQCRPCEFVECGNHF